MYIIIITYYLSIYLSINLFIYLLYHLSSYISNLYGEIYAVELLAHVIVAAVKFTVFEVGLLTEALVRTNPIPLL